MSVLFACFLSLSEGKPLCVPHRSNVCSVCLLPQSVEGHAPLHPFSKSRLFHLLASSVSLRPSPFASLFEISSVPFARFLSQSEDMSLCVPLRSHVCSVCFLPLSVRGQAPLRAFAKSRPFRLLASSACLRTSPFACLIEVTTTPYACFHSLSKDKPLCLLPQSV